MPFSLLVRRADGGAEREVPVEGSESVAELQQRIAATLSTRCQVRVCFKGKELGSDTSIAGAGVTPAHFVVALLATDEPPPKRSRPPASAPEAAAPFARSLPPDMAASAAIARFGSLPTTVRGLAGPFQSICVLGEPRPGKRLCVMDIDHTLYDPTGQGNATISEAAYDASIGSRCRPGLDAFLCSAYREYDLMIWSASSMRRIMTLLAQMGLFAPSAEYRILAVLDNSSMSERPLESGGGGGGGAGGVQLGGSASLLQAVAVPEGARGGQMIEVRSEADGEPMVVTVPAGLRPGWAARGLEPRARTDPRAPLDLPQ